MNIYPRSLPSWAPVLFITLCLPGCCWALAGSENAELEPLVITASRYSQPANATPAHVTVISSADVKAAPARATDDVVRFVAGVQIKGGSSNIINPAPQNVSMMGVGGNTRVLVLMDGLPLTDGFGGWVNWSKVPLGVIERIEVVRGGSSSLYGSKAIGGVINVITRSPKERAADLDVSYGSRNTKRFNAYASDAFLNKFGLGVDYNYYQTDGYPWLPIGNRGPIDHNATARNWALQVKAASLEGGAAGPLWFVRGIMFNEDRNHGLDHFYDSRDELEVGAGFRRPLDSGGEVSGNAFVGAHRLDSTNSAINATRTREFILVRNYLPSQDTGGSLLWSQPFEALGSSVTLGVDVRHVVARNNQDNYTNAGGYVTSLSSGGQQTTIGVFGQWSASPLPGLLVVPSARVDYWQNHEASQTDASGTVPLAPQSFAFFSPRFGARYQALQNFALRGAVYRAFTAPTLQNLYRGAKPQNQTMLPNPNLSPEILRIGGEFGWDWTLGPAALRMTFFQNEIKNSIGSVTLRTGPTVTQAANISQVRSRGVVVEAPWKISRQWSLQTAYAYTEALIMANTASPGTVGNTIPDIPRHSASFKIGFDDPRILSARLAGRYVTKRWGNDTNTQNLDEYFVLDFSVSRWVTKYLEVYFDGENLTNRQYTGWQLGSLPVLGEPLYVGFGLRLHYR